MYYKESYGSNVVERYETDKEHTKIYPGVRTVKWFIIVMLLLLIVTLSFNLSLDRSLGYRMKKY